MTNEVAESIGLGKPIGALVQSVEAGGPAEKAGVEAGDIITKVDDRDVESSVELPRIVGSIKPGNEGDLAGVSPRQLRATCRVVVAELRAGEGRAPRRTAEREARQAGAR